MSEDSQYLIRWRGRQTGPFPLAEINRMLDDHKIGMGHEVLFENEWMSVEEFFARRQKAAVSVNPIRIVPVPAPVLEEKPPARVKAPLKLATVPGPPVPTERPRHRLVFALLAVLGGFAGLHNFYARQWLTGMLQILLSVATFLMGFGIIAAWIWAMIEALAVRNDGLGIEMT